MAYHRDPDSGDVVVHQPDPPRHMPKAGHWRTAASVRTTQQRIKQRDPRTGQIAPRVRGKQKPKPKGEAKPAFPANMYGVACEFRSKRRPTRAELRALIAIGALPPEAMPSRGGKK